MPEWGHSCPRRRCKVPTIAICERWSLDQLKTCLYRSRDSIFRSLSHFEPVNDVRYSIIKDTPRPSQECQTARNTRAEVLLRFFIDGSLIRSAQVVALGISEWNQNSGKFGYLSRIRCP